VNAKIWKKIASEKKKIQQRLNDAHRFNPGGPKLRASNIHYEISERDRGMIYGGIGAAHQMVRQSGLIERVNERVQLLKLHVPYHESDHVLNRRFRTSRSGVTTAYTWMLWAPRVSLIRRRQETSAEGLPCPRFMS
jgi:hypothetical protein